MASTLTYILLFSFIGSVAGLVGGLSLLINVRYAKHISFYLVSFAVGVLLGASFFDLLPEAAQYGDPNVWLWAVAGFLLFAIIEKGLIWHHSHEILPHKHRHKHLSTKSYVYLLVAGDTLHNFIDGVIIGGTFMLSIPLGMVTAFAVFLHEVPAEIGDFSVMLHIGWKRLKIIVVNLISALATFAGALGVYYFLAGVESKLPLIVALAAGSFIYIAGTDLLPELKHETELKETLLQIAMMILGVLVIYSLGIILPNG